MTFIITLIALIIERFFHWSHLRRWRWFNKYQQKLATTRLANWPSYALLIISILPLIIVVGLVNHLLAGPLHGIFKIVFGVLVLLYCMGPSNLWAQTFGCLSELHKEDPKIALDRAQACFGIAAPSSSQAFHQALTSAIFIEANQRIFAVVFWFVILGPIGAVLYRALALCANESALGLSQLAHRVQGWLDWLPVRLFTLLFALSGHFIEVFTLWKCDVKSGVSMNDKLLTECGIAAIDARENNHLPEDGAAEKSALELLDRTFIIGLVILAVIVLIIR
ncbi:MAG: regulatory signaling modulator protein AmpE [Gammaproteobacteria bacterium]